MRRPSGSLVIAFAFAGACACAALVGLDSGQPLPSSNDGGVEAAAGNYSDLGDPSQWSSVDVSTFDPGAGDYHTAVYDAATARVYFVPYAGGNPGRFAIYDTHQPFSAAASWSLTDVSDSTGLQWARGWFGGVVTGQTLYVLSHFGYFSSTSYGYDGNLAAWNTTKSPDAGWVLHDLSGPGLSSYGNVGLVFDGRWIYAMPFYHGAAGYDGAAVRVDSTGDLDASSAYEAFDISTLKPSGIGFSGGVFDGRYVYYVPTTGTPVTARFDTTAGTGFLGAASWSTFDLSTVNANAKGYFGAAFDGRYVYYAPDGSSAVQTHGLALRYDTTQPFGSNASWNILDLASKLNDPQLVGFHNVLFDGRYVTFIPTAFHKVVRFDTTGQFGDAAAWQKFDLGSLDAGGFAGSGAFGSAAFDGEYIYFAPFGPRIYRFHDRSPAAIPATIHGGSIF